MVKSKIDFTKGNITKKLILFALPFLVSSLLQAIYNITDLFIVSRYIGSEGVAAANCGGQIMNIAIKIATGLSMGGTVIIGQYIGAKDSEGVKKSISSFLLVIAIVGMLFSLGIVIFALPILNLINTDASIIVSATEFLQIYGVGIFFLFGYNSIFAMFKGIGNSKVTLIFVGISTIINFLLDLLFVIILDFGIKGAAWSTTIAIIACFIVSLVYFWKERDSFYIESKLPMPRITLFVKTLKIGIPSAIQQSIFGISMIFMAAFINKYGVAATAAVEIGSKIDNLVLLPIQALGAATTAVVAQNIGAKKEERVRKNLYATIGIMMFIASIAFVVVWLFAESMLSIFINDKDIIVNGVIYIKTVAFNYYLLSLLLSFNAIAIGSGNTIFPLITTIVNGFLFRIPLALFFENIMGMGLNGLFVGLGFANIGGVIAGFLYYKLGFWKKSL